MVAIGTQLGSYKIISPLGAGGMGEVYRAKDLRLGREVAIKVLPEHLAADSEALGRFEREARALAALSHPNILTIYDFNTDQGVSFTVMELLEGETLEDRIARSALPTDKALEVAIAIAEGLSAAHSRGIIHRDLKPSNIFLTSDGVVKILDFGLARVEKNALPQDQTSTPTVRAIETEPGVIMGTVPYMSPEQVCGESVDARSDIFSFGCMLYQMLTGSGPFSRSTAAETMAAILRDDPADLAKSAKEIPPEWRLVIVRCLEKKREDRFQSARDLVFALKAISSGATTQKFFAPGSWVRFRPAIWGTAALALLLVLSAALFFLPTNRGKTLNSLAVLPLANASADPNLEYLSDGITESLINSLSQLPDLTVMSRNSVFRYKGREIDPLVVGRELKVRAILLGRVVQRGDSLSISVELVDTQNNSHIWGDQYNRKLSDILALQEEVSKDISEKLLLKLTGEEQKRLTKHYTESTEAYQLYLKGRYYWNKRTAEGLKKGIEYFQQVTDMDPNYALAYAGLADCYNGLTIYSGFPPKDSFPKAKAAAIKALDIDNTLAEAHASLAFVRMSYDWDYLDAEKEFKRAIELNPNYATGHDWYGMYLTQMGRFDEAKAELKRAQQLDPLSLIINVRVGWPFLMARQYNEAIEQFRRVIELDANFWPAHVWLGRAYEGKSIYGEAIEEIQKAKSLNETIWISAMLGHAYAVSGRRGEAQKVLDDLKQLSKQTYVSPYYIATIYAGLGEKDQAFEWLEKAYEDRSEWLVWLKVDPPMDSLRPDRRFADLLKRVSLTK